MQDMVLLRQVGVWTFYACVCVCGGGGVLQLILENFEGLFGLVFRVWPLC